MAFTKRMYGPISFKILISGGFLLFSNCYKQKTRKQRWIKEYLKLKATYGVIQKISYTPREAGWGVDKLSHILFIHLKTLSEEFLEVKILFESKLKSHGGKGGRKSDKKVSRFIWMSPNMLQRYILSFTHIFYLDQS